MWYNVGMNASRKVGPGPVDYVNRQKILRGALTMTEWELRATIKEVEVALFGLTLEEKILVLGTMKKSYDGIFGELNDHLQLIEPLGRVTLEDGPSCPCSDHASKSEKQ